MKGVREFEEQFEKLGPLMFGLHDGHSEAPKVSDCTESTDTEYHN